MTTRSSSWLQRNLWRFKYSEEIYTFVQSDRDQYQPSPSWYLQLFWSANCHLPQPARLTIREHWQVIGRGWSILENNPINKFLSKLNFLKLDKVGKKLRSPAAYKAFGCSLCTDRRIHQWNGGGAFLAIPLPTAVPVIMANALVGYLDKAGFIPTCDLTCWFLSNIYNPSLQCMLRGTVK